MEDGLSEPKGNIIYSQFFSRLPKFGQSLNLMRPRGSFLPMLTKFLMGAQMLEELVDVSRVESRLVRQLF